MIDARPAQRLRRLDARRRRLVGCARRRWSLFKIVALVLPLLLCVAYLTLWERKAIGWSQIRPGPNRVGPFGLLQPIADAVKLIFKEIIRPSAANKGAVLPRPGDDHHAGARGVGGGAVRPRRRAVQHQRRPAVPDGDHVDRGVRRHHRRLGVELEVRVPRRAARIGADGQLRNRDGLRARRRADGLGQPEHDRDRAGAGRAAGLPSTAPRSCRGTGCRCCRSSSSTSSRAWPRPTATRSTWSRASPKSSPAT